MGVKVTNRSYSEIFTNGTTDWLLGNVGEWQKLKLNVECAVEYIAQNQNEIQIDHIQNSFTLTNGQNWGDYGFDVGQQISMDFLMSFDTDNNGQFDFFQQGHRDFTIVNMYGSTIEVDDVIGGNFDAIPSNQGSSKISNVIFYSNVNFEGIKMNYVHLTNDNYQSGTLNSLIDGTTTAFQLPTLNTIPSGTDANLIPIGLQSGMSVRNAKIKKISSNQNILTSYIIPQSDVLSMSIVDFPPPISGNDYNSVRCVKMNIQTPIPTHQSVLNNNYLHQSNSAGEILNGNQNQCFIHNALTSYSQQIMIDCVFRIQGVNGSMTNANGVRAMLVRYSNGASMIFAEQIELKRWENVNALINDNLSLNGVWDINVNTSDSFALVFEFYHNQPLGNQTRSIAYVVQGGSISLSTPNQQFPDFYKKNYEIEIEFMISTLFEDISNFQNSATPSFLTGDGSLTDNFMIEFFPEWNNPNVKIQNKMEQTEKLGNTGWFNENFNELPNDFTIDSVEYFDINGNNVDALDYTSPIKAKIIVSGVQNLGSQTECGFGFAWIPTDEEDFKNLQTPFYQNCFVQSGSLSNGFSLNTLFPGIFYGAGIGGASMDATNVRFSNVSGKIICEMTLTPNAQFSNEFEAKSENDRNYILWVSVADGTLGRNISNRVSLLVDFNVLTKNIPPAGEYPNITNSFLEHPFSETDQGEEMLEGIVQDDFLCRMQFKIPNDGSIDFQKMIFGIEANNIGLDDNFVLEKYEVDLTSYPTDSNGVQQFNFDQSRGFKLELGNNKNWVKIKREPLLDTPGFNGYSAFFATKIRYEDWIANNATPNAFFDANELNTGFNNDWIHYLRTSGWNINFFVKTNAFVAGNLLQYKNQWKFTFNDYDENTNISTEHKYFRDSDNTLLNIGMDSQYNKPLGVILSNEPTRIEISFDILDNGTWDINNVYAVTTIEIDRGAGRMEMRQLSSVWGSETDNPLIPLPGETKLKITVDPTMKILTTKCLVDPDLLDDAVKYRITGRVGCYKQGDPIRLGLYEKRYENKYE